VHYLYILIVHTERCATPYKFMLQVERLRGLISGRTSEGGASA